MLELADKDVKITVTLMFKKIGKTGKIDKGMGEFTIELQSIKRESMIIPEIFEKH